MVGIWYSGQYSTTRCGTT